jgi:hypothetical protein
MGNVKELERRRITESAGHYLSEQPSGDLYGAYLELKEAQDEGYGGKLADGYVVVWQPLCHMTVDQIIQCIENGARGTDIEDYPEFIRKIDFTTLRTQKTLLLETINNDAVDPEHKEGLEGILNLLDGLQDYAVDEMGMNPVDVFDFDLEEGRE